MNHLLLNLLSTAILVLLITTPTSARQLPGTYTDGTGTTVELYTGARRIISLAPNLTETICFLGHGSKLVGRSDFCNYPPGVDAVPTVGGYVDTSLEAIVEREPDLVLAYQGNSLELIGQLRQLGIPVVAFPEAAGLNEVLEQIRVVDALIITPGTSPFPEYRAYVELLDALSPMADADQRPDVFYGYPDAMSYSAGPGSFIHDFITRAGGRNIAATSEQRWPQLGAEFIFAANPEIILTATSCTGSDTSDQRRTELAAELSADPLWQEIAAVQSGRVFVYDADVLLRPGPRLLAVLHDFETELWAELGWPEPELTSSELHLLAQAADFDFTPAE